MDKALKRRLPASSRRGGGSRRGNKLIALDKAIKEAKTRLGEGGYLHLRDLWERLKRFGKHVSDDLHIQPLGGILWVLREMGGLLGRFTVLTFFAYLAEQAEVIILGVCGRKRKVRSREHFILQMRHRLEYCLEMLAPNPGGAMG